MKGLSETERFVLALAINGTPYTLTGTELDAADYLVCRGLCAKRHLPNNVFLLVAMPMAKLALRCAELMRGSIGACQA